MINNISYNNCSKPQFGAMWVNSKKVAASKRQGTNMIDELIKKMVAELREIAKDTKKVPHQGEFDVVWAEFENKDKAIDATHCLLKISPTGVKGAENERYLEVAALKRGSGYGAESVIGYGSTNDVIRRLNEQGIEQVIKDKFIKLSKDLEDI